MADDKHCETWKQFYWRWFKTAFEHPWTITDSLATSLPLVLSLFAWLGSKLHWLPVISEPTVNRLVWQVPLGVLAIVSVFRIIPAPYWIYRERHFAAAKRESELAQQLQEASQFSTPIDPVVELMRERQRLEIERQPLLEAEECGIKVIPTIKVGKDESDYRKEKIERINRDIAEINEQIKTRSIAPAKSAGLNLNKEWKELAARFETLPNYVRADWQCNRRNNQTEYENWNFAGGTNTQVETLCRYAGKLLMQSPNIMGQLSANVTEQSDLAWKWLVFLKEHKRAFKHEGASLPTEDGTIVLLGTINHIGVVSQNACLDCAGAEL
jgi:hypothetical protein